jgi:hypothetical protein
LRIKCAQHFRASVKPRYTDASSLTSTPPNRSFGHNVARVSPSLWTPNRMMRTATRRSSVAGRERPVPNHAPELQTDPRSILHSDRSLSGNFRPCQTDYQIPIPASGPDAKIGQLLCRSGDEAETITVSYTLIL